jgi:hypothetical protein
MMIEGKVGRRRREIGKLMMLVVPLELALV